MTAILVSSATVSNWQPGAILEPSLDENIRAQRKGFQRPLCGRDFGGPSGCGDGGYRQADETRPYPGGIFKILHT